MEEFERSISNLGAYAAVRQRLEEMVISQQKALDQLQEPVNTSLV